MRLHANARLSVKGRELLIERVEVAGWSLTEAAAAGVSERTARKWRDRVGRARRRLEAGARPAGWAPSSVYLDESLS
jgi:leucine-zipper of insertion element IS481